MSPPVILPENVLNGNGNDPPAPRWLRWLLYSAERFGVATIILIAVGWWFASRIAEPLVQSHIDFLKVEQKTSESLISTQRQAAESLEKIVGTQREMVADRKETAATLVAAQREVSATLALAQRESAAVLSRNNEAIISNQGKIIEAVAEVAKIQSKQADQDVKQTEILSRSQIDHEQQLKRLDAIDGKLPAKPQ